jgi:hypothetical protein
MATKADLIHAIFHLPDDAIIAFEWDGQEEFANGIDLWSGEIIGLDDGLWGKGVVLKSQGVKDRES